MGTNYYWKIDVCPHCNRCADELHIGKSSYGWCFGLRVHPEEGIHSLSNWKDYWETNKDNGRIENEYHEVVSVEEMIEVITNRLDYCPDGKKPLRHIELQRHYGKEVVWQGEGHWDLIDTEFS